MKRSGGGRKSRDHRRFDAKMGIAEENANMSELGERRFVPSPMPSTSRPMHEGPSHTHFDDDDELDEDEVHHDEGDQDEEDDVEESDDEDSNALLNKDMSTVPLEQLLALRDRLGPALYEKAVFKNAQQRGDTTSAVVKPKSAKPVQMPTRRTGGQKRPREISSKRVSAPRDRPRNMFGDEEKLFKPSRDPRFDARCGEFDAHIHNDNYKWMDEVRETEMNELKKELRKETRLDKQDQDAEKVARIKMLIKTMADAERNKVADDKERTAVRQLRRENMERMKKGVEPVFVTQAAVKTRQLKVKYDELVADGKLNKYMRKKEKKMKGQALKFEPRARRER